MLDESGIIGVLQAAFASSASVVGIGDDAAVLPLSDSENYVISKDILVEHRHFRLTTTDAASLAHKALHVNLSDIAAMGAAPLFVLMGIALPPHMPPEWVEQFLSAFADVCKQANVMLIGGDTTASERDLFISITVIGKANRANLKFRNAAKTGDVLAVAGVLGEAHAGLMVLEKNVAGLNAVKAASLRPQARMKEGAWLGSQTSVTAMMDVSDGLAVDLGRMLKASQAGAVVDLENLQPSKNLSEACATLALDPHQCMLAGGEDYALLIACAADNFEKLAQEFQSQFGYALTKIGAVTGGKELEWHEGGKKVDVAYRSFSHFGEL